MYSGFGKSLWEWPVLDRVKVPAELTPGEYVLSWRWDCEESTQVWQNCADITVVAEAGGGAWDTASVQAVAKIPEPPAPAKASKNTDVDPCAANVAFCEGKGEVKGKCGATEEETRAMCEKSSAEADGDGAAAKKKGGAVLSKKQEDAAVSFAAPPFSFCASWLAALAAALCVMCVY